MDATSTIARSVTSHGVDRVPESAPLPLSSFFLPAVVFLLLVGAILFAGLQLTAGHFAYGLDDAYIHLAIARNLAEHGVFGVTSHEFSSASSSILWPLLLAAGCKVFGVRVLLPLLLQLIFGTALLWLGWRLLRRAGIASAGYVSAVLVVVVLAAPLPALSVVGMEHVLHIFATVLFAGIAAESLSSPSPALAALAASAALLCSVRYEGAFLVAAAALLLSLEKHFTAACAAIAAGASPIVLFGLYSLRQGGFFLPNSVLIKKSNLGSSVLSRSSSMFHDSPETFVLVGCALLLLAFAPRLDHMPRSLLKLFLLAALSHQLLAAYGWFYRYEAYLVTFGTLAVTVAAYPLFDQCMRKGWLALAMLVLLSPLAVRGIESALHAPHVMADIYRQQIQMAHFVQALPPTPHLVLNDIGAVSFYADPYLIDLEGLGSTEIARAWLEFGHPRPLPAFILRKTHPNDVEYAIVYDDWFGWPDHNLPEGWIRVGTWSLENTPATNSRSVSFYGVGATHAAIVREHLQAFNPSLPPEEHAVIFP